MDLPQKHLKRERNHVESLHATSLVALLYVLLDIYTLQYRCHVSSYNLHPTTIYLHALLLCPRPNCHGSFSSLPSLSTITTTHVACKGKDGLFYAMLALSIPSKGYGH